MAQRKKRLGINKRSKSKAFWGKALAIFFALMAVCTVVSRAADSVIIPKVRLEKASSGNLNYKMQGTGSIKASEGELVTVPERLRVKQVTKAGTNIEAGEKLAVIDTDELKKELDEQNAKLEQLRLQLQKEKLSAKPDAVTPQTVSAGKNLEIAQNNYNEAAAKYEEAVQTERDEEAERQRKAEEDKNAAYDTLQMQGGESNVEAKALYDQTISNIEQETEQIRAEKQAQMDALEQNRDAMWDALNQAQAAYELAEADDENTRANQQKAQEGSGITQKGLEIDIRQQEKVVDRLKAIMDDNGAIKSYVKGTVTENSLTEGMVTSGQEYIRIGTGGYEFQAAIDKENASKLKVGDTMEVEFPAKKSSRKLKIAEIRSQDQKGQNDAQGGKDAPGESLGTPQNQGNIMYIAAKIEGDDYADGMEGSYTIKKESDIRYDWILPVEAIHEDSKGTYCLVSRKKDTILGEEYVAERVTLAKKAKDVNQVAVEGALSNESKVIVESSKELNEGDRFRIEENN